MVLTESIDISRYSALVCAKVNGEVLPWAVGDVSGEYGLYWLGCLVLGAHSKSLDIVSNVGTYAGPNRWLLK